MENTEHPLVTFAVIAYNQEKYIREAIEGAFSQTYSPLEIILSDDNSPDSTFSIMEEMASNYTGPHKIILNRNNPNLGIGGHINRMMELSSGEFIVVNAGDDISVPERTEEMVKVWLDSNRTAKSICSDAYRMSIDGNIESKINFKKYYKNVKDLELYIKRNGFIIGATHGWDKDIFNKFGPINPDIVNEDRALPFRSLLLGTISYIEKPLIMYRDGGISTMHSNLSGYDYLFGKRIIDIKRNIDDCNQKINDIENTNVNLKIKEFKRKYITRIIKKELMKNEVILKLSNNKFGIRCAFNSIKSRVSIFYLVKFFVKYKFSYFYIKYVDGKNGK